MAQFASPFLAPETSEWILLRGGPGAGEFEEEACEWFRSGAEAGEEVSVAWSESGLRPLRLSTIRILWRTVWFWVFLKTCKRRREFLKPFSNGLLKAAPPSRPGPSANDVRWAIRGSIFWINNGLPFSAPRAKGLSHVRQRIPEQPMRTGCHRPVFLFIKRRLETKVHINFIFVFESIRKLVLYLIMFCRNRAGDESLNKDLFFFFLLYSNKASND